MPSLIYSSNLPGKQQMPLKLLEPFKLGALTLPNRFVMAPLSRNRAVAGLVPNPLAFEYYGQRFRRAVDLGS